MHPAVSNGSYDVSRVREDFPILGMQMLYFADPELARRSAIPPPATTRPPLPPAVSHLDKPEFISDDDATTGLERGFIEELRRT